MAQADRPARVTVFHPEFRDDLHYWIETDRRLALRALELVEAKYRVPGAWSRRPTQGHRIVRLVSDDRIDFLQARYHY